MIKKFTAVDNLEKVMENPDIDVVTTVTVGMADAYETSKESAEHVEEVVKELEKVAEPVVTEHDEAPEVPETSIYTKKLTLDESIEDFKLRDEEDEEDPYLDFDMYNFIYNMVTTESYPKVKIPVQFDHPMRRFDYAGSDDYIKTNSNVGVPQISTDVNSNITLYNDDPDYFDDVKAVCDYYKIKYSDVVPSRNKDSHWKYNMTIFVPSTSSGYPMMAEDFFAEQGLELSDVIEDEGIGSGKRRNWGNTYSKKVDKDRKEAEKILNDGTVERIFEKNVQRAARSNDPLENFLADLFKELDTAGLTYSKRVIKKRFMDEFDDDFED